MKYLFISAVFLLAGQAFADSALPQLHKISGHQFSAPYSCNGSYEKSALFLSMYTKNINAPDLLFNGVCRKSSLYFEASTAGDDFSLISDLGKVSLESVSASKAFNYRRAVGEDNTFKENVKIQEGHTYSVLLSKSDVRALYIVTVDKINPDLSLSIRYAVKSYSIVLRSEEVPGFNWEKGNH